MLTTVLPAILAVSLCTHLGLGLFAWRAYRTPLGEAFSLSMLATAGWVFCFSSSLLGTNAALKIFSHCGLYVFVPLAAQWWYLSIVRYTSRNARPVPGLPIWVWLYAVTTSLLALTSSYHSLFLTELRVIPWNQFQLVQHSVGPLFSVHFICIQLILAMTLRRLGIAIRESQNRFFFWRNTLLFTVSALPMGFAILFIMKLNPIPGYGLAPFLLAPIGVLQWFLLFRFRLLEILPIARDTLFQSLSDGILVFDENDVLVDVNPAATRLPWFKAAPPIGLPMKNVLSHPEWSSWLEAADRRQEFVYTHAETGSIWECSQQSIVSAQGSPAGRLLVFRDITARHTAEQRVRESEEHYRTIMESAGLPILIVDHEQHRIVYANPAALSFSGYREDELVGRSPLEFYHDAAQREAILADLQKVGAIDHREVIFRLSGERKAITLMSVRGLMYRKRRAALVTLIDITNMRQTEKALQAIELRNRELMVAELERQRIGRDLHDDIGQQLTGLGLLAGTLHSRLAAAGRHDLAEIDRLRQHLSQLIQKTRALAHGLNPVDLHGTGLWYALRELAHATTHQRLECRFDESAPAFIPNPEIALQVFRIAQEAVQNAVRHADATRVEIALTVADTHGTLVVRDNGTGFCSTGRHDVGHGLRIMRFRTELIGGSLTIDSEAGRGACITCEFPIIVLVDAEKDAE